MGSSRRSGSRPPTRARTPLLQQPRAEARPPGYPGRCGDHLLKRIYSHLGAIRQRSEVVEYRVEKHRDLISGRLKAL